MTHVPAAVDAASQLRLIAADTGWKATDATDTLVTEYGMLVLPRKMYMRASTTPAMTTVMEV